MSASTNLSGEVLTVVKTVRPWHIALGVGIICLLILLLGGWSLKQFKDKDKIYMEQFKVWEEEKKELKQQITETKRVTDSLTNALEESNIQRERDRQIYNRNQDEKIKKITSPGFTDDDIRRGFAER